MILPVQPTFWKIRNILSILFTLMSLIWLFLPLAEKSEAAFGDAPVYTILGGTIVILFSLLMFATRRCAHRIWLGILLSLFTIPSLIILISSQSCHLTAWIACDEPYLTAYICGIGILGVWAVTLCEVGEALYIFGTKIVSKKNVG